LLSRDLTINSIAIELNFEIINIIDKKFEKKFLIDYSNGFENIKDKIIKINSKNVIIDDPLRLLRIFRFSSKYNFKIENETFDGSKNLF